MNSGNRTSITIAGFFLAAGLLAVWWLVRHSPASSQDASSPPQSANISLKDQGIFRSYAGSNRCAECHQEEYDDWKSSHHGAAERRIDSANDARAFNPPRTFQHATQHTDVRRTDSAYQFDMLGRSGNYEWRKAERVIGEDPLRQYLVPFPGGRLQTLEASYDPRRDEWFNVYGSEDRQPGEWGHWSGRGMNWNSQCAGCHNTRLLKNYEPTTDTYATSMAEMSVGCEACHGPMLSHVDWQNDHPRQKGVPVVAVVKESSIVPLTSNNYFDACAACHSRRIELAGDFVPGESYDDHFALVTVDASETYYPDGQVHDEDYEVAAFLGSRMYARGVRCNDCHQSHTAKVRMPGNILCMRCHNGYYPNSPVIDPKTHAHHTIDSLYNDRGGVDLDALLRRDPASVAGSGGECVNCHMPQTFYMQRHRRHDHGFTIPDPLLTKEFGIPNACNRCHAGKSADWAEEWTAKWYGGKMSRQSRNRARVFANARLGTQSAGDSLISYLGTDASPYWRASSAALLRQWVNDPRAAGALVKASADLEPLVRANAVRTLGEAGEGGSVEAKNTLIARLEDPSRNVRFYAASAMESTLDPHSPRGIEFLSTLTFLSDQPTGQMHLGSYDFARGNTGEALGHYQKSIEWDPNSAPLRHDYAVILATAARSQEAVEQLEAACRLEPKQAEFRFKLALGYNELGRTDKAIEAFQACLNLDARYTKAWYNLGLALNSVGRTNEALDALKKTEALDPSDPRSPYARATILAGIGRTEEAIHAAEHALELQPDFAPAKEFLLTIRQPSGRQQPGGKR